MLCVHISPNGITVFWAVVNHVSKITILLASSTITWVQNLYESAELCNIDQLLCTTNRNIVSTVNLDCKLDLKAIALQARNAEYNPKVWILMLVFSSCSIIGKIDVCFTFWNYSWIILSLVFRWWHTGSIH